MIRIRSNPNALKLLIAADCSVDKLFVNTIESELCLKVDVLYIDSTGKKRIQVGKRHISYLLTAIKSFMYKKNYKYIIFWQQFIGFYYSVITKLCFSRGVHPISLALPLIYKQRKGVFGKIYKFLFSFFLGSDVLDSFVCHSTGEREFYIKEFGEKYRNKILFIKYGIKMPESSQIIDANSDKNRYFFSGGTSNRDYQTLIKVFERLDEQIKIACFPTDVNGLKIPSNVEVLYNVFGDDFLDYMRKAYAVIISLDDPNISSGQLVLLSAMRLGKAIIITRSNGIEDYIDNKCAIFVKPHSAEDVWKAIDDLVSDKRKLRLLGVNARRKYETDFTIEKFGKRIANILEIN